MLKDNGGAVKVSTGGAFCAALTRSGRVVLWGQPLGSEAVAAAPSPAAGLAVAATAGATAATAAAASVGRPVLGHSHGRRRRHRSGSLAHMPDAAAPAARRQQQQEQQAAAAGGEQQEVPNLRIQKQGGLIVAEVVDLPPILDLACGFSHINFTDGTSVWAIGRWAQGGQLHTCLRNRGRLVGRCSWAGQVCLLGAS